MHEQRRYRCEIRYVLSLGKKGSSYLAKVAEKRGKAVADQMREEARRQWKAGNRGNYGDWK